MNCSARPRRSPSGCSERAVTGLGAGSGGLWGLCEGIPRLGGGGGGLAFWAAAPVVAPAAPRPGPRREHLVVLLPRQRCAHPLVRLGALRGDVLGPPQV